MSNTDTPTTKECLTALHAGLQVDVLKRALGIVLESGDSTSKAVAKAGLFMADSLTVHGSKQGAGEGRAYRVGLVDTSGASKPKAKSSKKKAKAAKKKTHVRLLRPERFLNGAPEGASVSPSMRLSNWRKGESLSQKKAAALAEVSVSSWQAWESGKWDPSGEMMNRLEKLGI